MQGGHGPLISFLKFLRSHSSLNAKIHTLNDIGIFFFKYHYEANIIFYNLFFYCKSKFTWHICVLGLLSSTWVKNQVFIAKFGQKVLPIFIESPLWKSETSEEKQVSCNFSRSCSFWIVSLMLSSLLFKYESCNNSLISTKNFLSKIKDMKLPSMLHIALWIFSMSSRKDGFSNEEIFQQEFDTNDLVSCSILRDSWILF